jgi:hypothetical protein
MIDSTIVRAHRHSAGAEKKPARTRRSGSHGVLADLVPHNSAREVDRSGSEGFHSWTADEAAQFEARHPVGTKARLALALLPISASPIPTQAYPATG